MSDGGTPWHAEGAEAALDRLATSHDGLSAEEAAARLARTGPNALPDAPGRGWAAKLRAQFDNLLILVLIAAGVVTALMGQWIDAGVIVAVVVVNALVGLWQEGKAENALAAVRSMLAPVASVLRDGHRVSVPAETLVPGDVVFLEPGDRVPADLRLIECRGLRIGEAALTGESASVGKSASPVAEGAVLSERSSMAYSGTMVGAGRGLGVVVATGRDTEIGHIGALLAGVRTTRTPLLRQVDRFARLLTWVILGLCAAVFAYAVFVAGRPGEPMFLAMVGLAVAAIPEGLPAVLTITLAIGVQRMAARSAIVRRLPAVETLGAVSVICTDKTGTLTQNEMVLRRVVAGPEGAEVAVTGSGYAPDGALEGAGKDAQAAARRLALTGLLCNDARLQQDGQTWRVAGDGMEGALVAFAAKAGLEPEAERRAHPRRAEIPFDADTRLMAVLTDGPDGPAIHVKGAPDVLLGYCTRDATGADGAGFDHAAWARRIEALAAEGYRVLAFATRAAEGGESLDAGDLDGLTLLGIAGFIDPPRPEAPEAVADCRSAGVEVKMITGDHALTALAVAGQLGLDTTGGAVTGAEIAAMDADALRRCAARTAVFARVAPEQKLRLVEALQAGGRVVAMTGDGVNDAPALKRADVGVAMGITGTEAAKDAARVVLADDNFATIVAAVREGRTINDNIRKVIGWILPTNGGESLVVIAAILLGLPLPITAIQILWINMVSDVTLGLTLAFEPSEPEVMKRPPRRADAPLLDREMLWRVVLVSVLFAVAIFGLSHWSQARGDPDALTRTLAVNLLVVMEIAYLFSVRFLHMRSLTWRGILGTRAVLTGIGVTVAAQAAFTYAPFMNAIFGSRPVSLADGALVVGIGAGLFVLLEVEKWLRRRFVRAGG